MNTIVLTSVVMAAAAVVGCIGSVLLLAYRVGRLTGTLEARVKHGEDDRVNIWQAIGKLGARFDRHTELAHKVR